MVELKAAFNTKMCPAAWPGTAQLTGFKTLSSPAEAIAALVSPSRSLERLSSELLSTTKSVELRVARVEKAPVRRDVVVTELSARADRTQTIYTMPARYGSIQHVLGASVLSSFSEAQRLQDTPKQGISDRIAVGTVLRGCFSPLRRRVYRHASKIASPCTAGCLCLYLFIMSLLFLFMIYNNM